MKRKHCFDSVGRWSVSGDAAGDTGRGTPYVSGTTASLIQRRDRGVSGGEALATRRKCGLMPHVEFGCDQDRQWSACLSLLEAGEELKKIFN